MRTALASCVVLLGMSLTISGDALGAATRTEYIALVDPICQAEIDRGKGFQRQAKRLETLDNIRKAKPRYRRAFVSAWADWDRTTEEIALVSAAPGDEAAVAVWIEARREYGRVGRTSIASFVNGNRRRVTAIMFPALRNYFRAIGTLVPFGFQHCVPSSEDLQVANAVLRLPVEPS